MLEKCASDYNFFFLASTNLEVWGNQFKSFPMIQNTEDPLYNSMIPGLKHERKFVNCYSGEQFPTDYFDGRFRNFLGQRASLFEQL